jgi:hypothetical protein
VQHPAAVRFGEAEHLVELLSFVLALTHVGDPPARAPGPPSRPPPQPRRGSRACRGQPPPLRDRGGRV